MYKLSEQDKKRITAQAVSEYQRAEAHTRTWKENVKNVEKEYLLPKPKSKDKIKIKKVLNNLTIRLATFLPDEIQVTNIPMNWRIGKETAENCDTVLKACFDSMRIKEKYRSVLINDALTWVWVEAVDGWNDHKQEPILSFIDSRLCYPDPKNWQGSNMSFFGTKVRKSWYELTLDGAYDQAALLKCKAYVDTDQQELQRNQNSVKDFQEDLTADEHQTDLYNHVTIFRETGAEKACVYLLTFGAGMWELVRCVKMRPLTEAEIEDPSEINLGVILYRAKPLPWSFAGVSLIDDIWDLQDLETLLTNLYIHQAKVSAKWGRTLLDSRLGISAHQYANQTWPWDVLTYTVDDPSVNIQSGLMQEDVPQFSPILTNAIEYVARIGQQADPTGSSITQGQSLPWSQTKAEVQTIQQNINQVLSYMQSNYMDSIKERWTEILKSFARNMSSQRTKEVVIINDDGRPDAFGFKKNEFVPKWDVYLVVKSRSQEDIKDKQDFSVTLSIYGSLVQGMAPDSVEKAVLDRFLIEKSGIRGIDAEVIKPLTLHERRALQQLELLNNNIPLDTKPKEWEPHSVYINIFRNGIPTEERDKAIQARQKAELLEPPKIPQQEQAKQGWVAQQLWASMIQQDRAGQMPSLADVASN